MAWSCLVNYLKEENKSIYTPKDKYIRKFIRDTVKGGRVIASNCKSVSSLFNNIIEILEKHFEKGLERTLLFEKRFKNDNRVKNYYENRYE